MATLAELADAPVKILDFGPSGSGKSAFWATLGEDCEFIESDPNGYTTLRHFQDKWTEKRQKVDISYFQEVTYDGARAWGLLKNRAIEISNLLTLKKYPKKVVVFDTLTSMGDLALRSVKGGKIFAPTTIQQWGLAMSEIEQVVTIARSWPIPAVFIGHAETSTTDAGSMTNVSVIGQKLLPKLVQYMEEIYYSTVIPLGDGKQRFCFQTVRSPGVEVKSRRNLPNHFDKSEGAHKLFEAIKQPL